jgi:hypothetical protein
MATRRKKTEIVAEPTETCKTCRHAWSLDGTWFCRRYPPVVHYDYQEASPVSTFPVTAADITCGEYSPLLNS